MTTPVKPRNDAGSNSRGARKPSPYLIEGEYITLEQIATRLRVSEWTARSRIARERGRDGPVTWAKLESVR